MGIDLTLMMEPWDIALGTIFPVIQLPLERRSALWDRITDELETLPLGREIYWHDEDEGLVTRTDDQYGTPLRYAQAGSLAKLMWDFNAQEESPPWMNAAAAAYLGEMMPVKSVILWWC